MHRLLLGFSLFGWPLNAQHVLRTSAEIPAAGVSNFATAGPVRCDSHGDIYLRVANAPDTSHQLLTRIGRDGGMTTFGPEKVSDPELKGWRLADFAVSNVVWVLDPFEQELRLEIRSQGRIQRSCDARGRLLPAADRGVRLRRFSSFRSHANRQWNQSAIHTGYGDVR
jgi:hypothetical protein